MRPVASRCSDEPFQASRLPQSVEVKNCSDVDAHPSQCRDRQMHPVLTTSRGEQYVRLIDLSLVNERICNSRVESTVCFALADDYFVVKQSIEYAGIPQQWVIP